MHGGILTQLLLGAMAIALLVASWTDIRRREIDNGLNAAIALGAPLFWWSSGMTLEQVGWHLAVAVVTFIVLLAMFALRGMGGGDVKLLTALALWIEPLWFLRLLVVMSIIGGVLTLGFLGWHLLRRRQGTQQGRIAVPYGIAISAAGLWALACQYLPAGRFLPLDGSAALFG